MSSEHHLSVGGFGRRGAQPLAMPSAAMAPGAFRGDPSRPLASWAEATPAGVSRLKAAGLTLLAVPALLCVEAMLSGTSLITPISPLFGRIMWGVGFTLGIPLTALVVLKPHKPMGAFKTLMIILFLPILTGFAANMAAWRIADWIHFTGSSARFEPASYPIKYASHGRKGRRDSFEIDPFNLKSATGIGVPGAQFDAIWPNHSDYCITVMQRRSASGAVEILNDGVFTMKEPAPAVLTPCPGAGRAGR